jgi:uncharacterized protein
MSGVFHFCVNASFARWSPDLRQSHSFFVSKSPGNRHPIAVTAERKCDGESWQSKERHGRLTLAATTRDMALLRRLGTGLAHCFVALAALGMLSFPSSAYAGALSAGERAYARHDYVRAAPLLLMEAERGSPAAQTYIGYMYQNGLGVPRNYSAAAGWLNEAAQQGEPTAQFLLGLLFDKGYGVPMDWVQAEVWLNLAASQANRGQRDYWERMRNAVAQKLTLDQVAEAQQRAYAWAPNPFPFSAPIRSRY